MSQNNDQELKIYDITNRTTGETSCQPASNTEDACKQAGWLVGDCYVNPQKPRIKPAPDHESLVLVKIPCEICPFQYAECKKPPAEECSFHPTALDFQEWLNQAAQAHRCQHSGQKLNTTDYRKRQKWLNIEDAIKELAPKDFSLFKDLSHSTC